MSRHLDALHSAGFALALGFAACAPASSDAALSPHMVVSRAWTRPAMAGMNAAGYATLSNTGREADRLTGAACADAARVTIHQSRQMGAVMTMRPVAALDIAAGASVSLAPGGYHLMLEGLKRSLRPGEKLTVRLHFAKGGDLAVGFAVITGAAMTPHMAM